MGDRDRDLAAGCLVNLYFLSLSPCAAFYVCRLTNQNSLSRAGVPRSSLRGAAGGVQGGGRASALSLPSLPLFFSLDSLSPSHTSPLFSRSLSSLCFRLICPMQLGVSRALSPVFLSPSLPLYPLSLFPSLPLPLTPSLFPSFVRCSRELRETARSRRSGGNKRAQGVA